MPTQPIKTLYPLATQDGVAIPFEVAKPIDLARLDFTDTGSAIVNLSTVDCLLAFFATNDCLVKFGGQTASVIASGEVQDNVVFVPRFTVITVSPLNLKYSVAAALAGQSGVVWIQALERWTALVATETMFTRK